MRRILFFTSAVLIFLISGCKVPVASFIFTPESVAVGDTVYFQSTSQNAVSFKWDLGDGTESTAEHPIHIYETAGEFSVVLVIYNHRGSDKTRNNLNVSQSSP
jgi:PKD repeat protein